LEIAIVIPAHNEAATIGDIVAKAKAFGMVIVVDDGSHDGTGDVSKNAGAHVVHHPHNRGYDAALQSGFEAASKMGVEIVVTLDADGQHDAGSITNLIAPFETSAVALVIGTRATSARWMEGIFGAYTKIRYGVPDILCGAKGYRMELFRHPGMTNFSGSIGTELAMGSLRRGVAFQTVPIEIYSRQGRSRFGGSITANWKILKALVKALWRDAGFRSGGRHAG
jgi:glycosyltransferase involved in cell wall biosynthesis